MRYNEQIALKKILCQKQQQTCAKTTCEAIYKEQLFLCISNTSISCWRKIVLCMEFEPYIWDPADWVLNSRIFGDMHLGP